MGINEFEIKKLGHLELLARQVVEGFITGLHKSPFHGFSVEFAEHRLYNAGESTRHIDWKLFGRSDKLFVKRYEEETNLRCQLVIDTSSSMFYPKLQNPDNNKELNKIRFAAYASACIMHMLQLQRDAVGLSTFAGDVELNTRAGSTLVHQQLIYTELNKLFEEQQAQQKRQSNVASALHIIAESIHKRSLVIIFSDFMDSVLNLDDIFNALQHLRHNKHEVVVFNVKESEKEQSFDFENRPHWFIDIESGQEIKLQPQEIKEKYLQEYQKYQSELKLRCQQFRIDMVDAPINEGFLPVLQAYMIKRAKML